MEQEQQTSEEIYSLLPTCVAEHLNLLEPTKVAINPGKITSEQWERIKLKAAKAFLNMSSQERAEKMVVEPPFSKDEIFKQTVDEENESERVLKELCWIRSTKGKVDFPGATLYRYDEDLGCSVAVKAIDFRCLDKDKTPKQLLNSCKTCGKVASSKCARCKNVYYCCKDHQEKDWQFHRTVCKSVDVK